MRLQSILVIIGLFFVVFGLGLWMGSHLYQEHSPSVETPLPMPSVQISSPSPAGLGPACVDVRNTEPLVGKTGCVTGLVLRVASSRTGNTYLDFCQDYHTCPFSSVVFASDKSRFGDLGALQGKRVEIRGDIRKFQGRAEIIIRDPQQIRATP